MKLKISSIHGHGDASKEYVVLDVNEDCIASYYIIADTTYTSPGYISNKHRHVHRFVRADLKAGDVVILYTRVGSDEVKKHPDGSATHYRFWNLKTPVWNDDGDGAILFEINDWKTSKVADTK